MEQKIVELDRPGKTDISDNDDSVDYHGGCVQPVRRRRLTKSQKIDRMLAKLDHDLQLEIEDIYGLWNCHPGVG